MGEISRENSRYTLSLICNFKKSIALLSTENFKLYKYNTTVAQISVPYWEEAYFCKLCVIYDHMSSNFYTGDRLKSFYEICHLSCLVLKYPMKYILLCDFSCVGWSCAFYFSKYLCGLFQNLLLKYYAILIARGSNLIWMFKIKYFYFYNLLFLLHDCHLQYLKYHWA